ncbi:MAG: DNA-processing protein DprA [Nitrospiraceae bacterium]
MTSLRSETATGRTVASLRPWFELRAVPGIGDALLCRLVQSLGSLDAVLHASHDELTQVGGVSPALAKAIHQGIRSEDRQAIDRELKALERLPVQVLTILDPDYPARLKAIHDPPPLLSVSGTLSEEDRHAVAIVGTRHATPAGRVVTEQLSRGLAAAGLTVVSGLARGIDGTAHRSALEAGGRTIAVLGCGIDRTYPPEHQSLRKKIEEQGAVLSELPLGAYPHAYHFPKRNRIISGLSLGVVVVEAASQSGSLITARLAAEQGREVFAVPGSVQSEQSHGTNGLIKQGAKLVERVDDIIEELLPQMEPSFAAQVLARRTALTRQVQSSVPVLEHDEAVLYAALSTEPVHIDELISKTGLPAASVSGLLLALELKGAIRQLPGHACIKV